MSTATPQEEFWAGEFGDEYSARNQGNSVLASKIAMFSRILSKTSGVKSVRELGANIGLNILALRALLPGASFQAVEINPTAFKDLERIPDLKAMQGSLFTAPDWPPVDLAFTAGVLIHVNPDMLPTAYDRLYNASRSYLLVTEYYNSSPVEISYRGHAGKLFKRDFAGEILERFPDLELVDYGFIYHRDPIFPGDDLTWFLMRKN